MKRFNRLLLLALLASRYKSQPDFDPVKIIIIMIVVLVLRKILYRIDKHIA